MIVVIQLVICTSYHSSALLVSTSVGWEPLSTSLSIKVVSVDEAYTLDPKVALHIRALDNYSDQFGIQR